MGAVDDIANRYVEEWAELDPVGATHAGIAGYDARMTDLSPDGYAALAALDRTTLAALATARPADERELVAKEAMAERVGLTAEMYDAGLTTSEVNVVTSALHTVRTAFDLMPIDGEPAAANIAVRMAALPLALGQWRATLLAAAGRGHVSSRRQIRQVSEHYARWAARGGDNFFPALAGRVTGAGRLPATLVADLERAAAAAAAATAATGVFLREELAPLGREHQAVGREHYQLASRFFLGTTVDLDDAYAWGFDELARIEAEMRAVSARIVPGGGIDAAVEALDADPSRTIPTREAFRDWMQELADRAISDLHGTHFDIPEPVRRIECAIAPTSDGGIYYTPPSEDFSRAGQMWWAVPDTIAGFSTWREVTTVYHEGAPGHHLQVGQTLYRSELLNRWQRLLCWCSGHGEGWALYAERLMDELGYLEDPGNRLGMLDAQALRASRVIVDIGMHLELPIPVDNPFGFHPGQRWTPRLGGEFLRAHTRLPDELLRFELNRYLGWPGQAPSYKLGERFWLSARAAAKAAKGPAFDLAAFHREVLNLGALGLDPLGAAIARL